MASNREELGVTEEDRRVMAALADGTLDERAIHVSGEDPVDLLYDVERLGTPGFQSTPHDIGTRICEGWRSLYESGEMNTTEIGEWFDVYPSTVAYHVNGGCKHNRKATVDAARCRVIRVAAQDELSYREIARTFSFVDYESARYHARGYCDHDVAIDPVGSRHTAKPHCGRFRELSEEGYTDGEIAEMYGGEFCRSIVSRHVRGGCECDTEIPVPEDRR